MSTTRRLAFFGIEVMSGLSPQIIQYRTLLKLLI